MILKKAWDNSDLFGKMTLVSALPLSLFAIFALAHDYTTYDDQIAKEQTYLSELPEIQHSEIMNTGRTVGDHVCNKEFTFMLGSTPNIGSLQSERLELAIVNDIQYAVDCSQYTREN